jgi:hypothetical protein
MWLLSDFLKMNLFYYIIYKSDTCTLHVFRNFPNWWRQTSVHIVTGRQSFMKLFFLLLWQLYWRVLWNYIYLNWNKALYRYFKIFNFFPSEIGNIALNPLTPLGWHSSNLVQLLWTHWRCAYDFLEDYRHYLKNLHVVELGHFFSMFWINCIYCHQLITFTIMDKINVLEQPNPFYSWIDF